MIGRIIVLVGTLGVMGGVVWASQSGLGVQPMRDQALMKEMRQNCPQHLRTADGGCMRRSYRSFFFAPIIIGGGPRYGK